mmetsp:Transcript_87449/g.276291  ORF Transcript_87449/g.276291 Transcript_87449/m.276291 type:complete len:508 (+) Transcript_87449:68-1591(+)
MGGRRGDPGGSEPQGHRAKGTQGQCPDCRRRLPRSAFPKAELSGGSGRCRDCVIGFQCSGCQVYMPRASFEAGSRQCRTCRGNAQLDRLLGTPKDEVTHFGAMKALRLEREAEYALVLTCCRLGLHDEALLRRILGFLRVPFVTHQNGVHYCELCDTSFQEAPVSAGQRLRMAMASSEAKWVGCPGGRLRFQAGESHGVAAVRQVSSGVWFFRTQARLRGRAAEDGSGGTSSSRGGTQPQFMPLWAPLSATEAAGLPSPLAAHLASEAHCSREEAVTSGKRLLVSRAALSLSKELGERPTTTHSRFVAGLSIAGRFCTPEDVEKARRLERVRDAEVPLKFLRDCAVGGQGRELLWISPEAMLAAVDAYEQKLRSEGKRGAGANAAQRGRERAQEQRKSGTGAAAEADAEEACAADPPGQRRSASGVSGEAAADQARAALGQPGGQRSGGGAAGESVAEEAGAAPAPLGRRRAGAGPLGEAGASVDGAVPRPPDRRRTPALGTNGLTD